MSHSLPQVLTVVVRMKNGGGKATVKCHAYWCTVQIIIIKKTSLDGRIGWGHSLRFMIRHQVLMAPLWILSEVPLSPSYSLSYSDANRVNSELILWYVTKSKHTLHLLGWFFFWVAMGWWGRGIMHFWTEVPLCLAVYMFTVSSLMMLFLVFLVMPFPGQHALASACVE